MKQLKVFVKSVHYVKVDFITCVKKGKILEVVSLGAFASHKVLMYIHKLPKNVSLEEAALIEPLAVCYNALIVNSNIKKFISTDFWCRDNWFIIFKNCTKYKKAKYF